MELSLDSVLPSSELADWRVACESNAPRSIRLKPHLAGFDQLPFETTSVGWHPLGRILLDDIRPSQSLHYSVADYYIQDAGSLLALAVLEPKPGQWICDLCAAPGGKASGILEAIQSESKAIEESVTGTIQIPRSGFLLANEPIRSRIDILEYALCRTGSPRYAIANMDPSRLVKQLLGAFDSVLVDAPCSGQAMVAKGKRDSNAFDPKHVAHSAARQRRILLDAVRLLRLGGKLVYSTCTFAIEENESQVEFLLSQFPGCFEPVNPSSLSRWESPIQKGCYRLWPHRDATSGAFAAGLILKSPLPDFHDGDEPGFNEQKFEKTDLRKPKPSKSRGAKNSHPDWLPWHETNPILDFGNSESLSCRDRVHFVEMRPSEMAGTCFDRMSSSDLSVLWPKVAIRYGQHWHPHHGLSCIADGSFRPKGAFDLDDQDAKRFAAGEAILNSVDSHGAYAADSQIPWQIARWNQRPLGWGKVLDRRINNHVLRQ